MRKPTILTLSPARIPSSITELVGVTALEAKADACKSLVRNLAAEAGLGDCYDRRCAAPERLPAERSGVNVLIAVLFDLSADAFGGGPGLTAREALGA